LTHNKKVIAFPSQSERLKVWSFSDFVYLGGSNPIEAWYQNDISDRARLAFDALLKANERIKSHLEWLGMEKQMQGELKGHQVWQWKIAGEVQYRILGVFSGQKRAVFLMGYYHKGGVYTPPNALKTTLDRKRLLDQGACKFDVRSAKDDL
jgi:hypothetical protein